ncbi:hypothetical protein GLOIN_2v1842735 [Rhizophagus clarus]|uniref:Uncharacterized protein n=1 Tax=Rhizophagus clarus TaxID=94130 RepID=A0A8H3QZU3_9GLOM|nr:hypothetical protein GLOIN_2v1842735 [Rhizophagus clarus]
MKTVKNTDFSKNFAPDLLSIVSEKMTLAEDNILLNLLIETVANIPLNKIEFGRLSIAGLKCLLSYTYKKEKPFTTPEYEVFRYSAILAAKEVSNDIYRFRSNQRVLSNDIYSNGIRGKPLKRDYALDESEAFGYAANHHNVRAKMMKVFSNGCYYVCFWSKHCIRYFWAGSQPTGCVLRLNGH